MDGSGVLPSVFGVGFGAVMGRVSLFDEEVYQLDESLCGLVGAALREILFIDKTCAQLVILMLGYPLPERLQVLVVRARHQGPEVRHLLQGGIEGQRWGRRSLGPGP